ncbi:DUF421 domain-containing protein [Bacillus sp. T33-2]|uniref:DUF421 domain-containing protein n=1 Tax=Bacillus sp. T33-2 TaxID=2054168 RepID=UPI000C78E8B3|nr:YetF domain-containing protein [Bacillus sp. T33-2]PLR89827.1 hypothetical protein CVD19_23385 [Bacillus sp. T33-2]
MTQWLDNLPSLPYPLKALLIVSAGIFFLRLAGKRSLMEMTVAETVLRISVGTVIITPLAMKKEWGALYGGALLIIGIIIFTWVMQKYPRARNFIIGPPSVVVKDGKMMMKEIKRARLTADEVEVAIRQSGISNLDDVELCILESSGRYSTTLKPLKKVATVGDVQNLSKDVKKLQQDMQKILALLGQRTRQHDSNSPQISTPKTGSLYKEAYDEAKGDGFAGSGKESQ